MWKTILHDVFGSRKGRTALATLVLIILTPYTAKLGVNEDMIGKIILAIFGLGSSIIVGHSVEDAGRHIANGKK